jgi:hypothetical protein
VDAAVRDGLARLRASSELVSRERIRGFVLDTDTGILREPHVDTS